MTDERLMERFTWRVIELWLAPIIFGKQSKSLCVRCLALLVFVPWFTLLLFVLTPLFVIGVFGTIVEDYLTDVC